MKSFSNFKQFGNYNYKFERYENNRIEKLEFCRCGFANKIKW